ncbi:hypothetical protein C2E15_10425 [Mixta gaviniae]|uniref:Uncharacterized protein n=1 Tax=Mixta gaviniae TaxID=665914 RepID=A0A2L0IG01_9GAMM|nr:hypothetical protein C2E15_10425 [Mixta gaviniae]
MAFLLKDIVFCIKQRECQLWKSGADAELREKGRRGLHRGWAGAPTTGRPDGAARCARCQHILAQSRVAVSRRGLSHLQPGDADTAAFYAGWPHVLAQPGRR